MLNSALPRFCLGKIIGQKKFLDYSLKSVNFYQHFSILFSKNQSSLPDGELKYRFAFYAHANTNFKNQRIADL